MLLTLPLDMLPVEEETMANTYLLAITCYNCAPQITRVLDRITPKIVSKVEEVMIINNRSTDDLEDIVKNYLDSHPEPKIHLYRNAQNYSLGGSQKIAFLHGEEISATHVIILHGDDQADPQDILPMIELIEQQGATTVLGSRFNEESTLVGYDKKRIFGNRVLNSIYSIVTRTHVEDLGSGLNIFALSDLEQTRYVNFADKLTFNFEALLDLIDRNIEFTYYPMIWREEDQVTNARNFNVACIAFKNLMSWKFKRAQFFGGEHVATDYLTRKLF